MSTWVSATYACERCGNRYTTMVYDQPNPVLGQERSPNGPHPSRPRPPIARLTVAASCWSRTLATLRGRAGLDTAAGSIAPDRSPVRLCVGP